VTIYISTQSQEALLVHMEAAHMSALSSQNLFSIRKVKKKNVGK